MGSQTKHTDTYKEDDGVQNEKATGRDGEKEANTERGRRRRAADACVEKIETTSVANAGCLRAPRRGGRGEQGGFLLEAAVCFAAVKSHTGNVGKHIQADASADDDRLRRSRSLDGGGKKHCHAGDFMLSTSLRAHGHGERARSFPFVVALHSAFFLSTTEAAHSSE